MSSFTLDVEPSVQALIKEVWHQSWEDFQSWKHQDLAPSEIAAASVGKTAGALVKQEQETQLYFLGPARSSLNDRPAQLKSSSRKSQTLKTWNFPLSADPDSNLVSQASHTIPVYPCDPADDILEPVPPYEACDPTNLTFQVIDTAAERETLEFMPFGNEPEFLAKNPFFLVDRKTGENIFKMQWEFSDRDPDVDMVICEAIRRLHLDHKLSVEEIDAAETLPKHLKLSDGSMWNPLTNRTALPWSPCDIPDIRPSFIDLFRARYRSDTTELSTDQRVAHLSHLMCANIGCIQPACPTHGLGAQPRPKVTKPTLEQLIQACGEICGNDCFKAQELGNPSFSSWSNADLQELKDIWKCWGARSGLSVCGLARMVFKPCWEVFQKLHAIEEPSDAESSDGASSEESVNLTTRRVRKKAFKLDFSGHDSHESYLFAPPCDHEGDCVTGANCVCIQHKLRCRRNCGCDPRQCRRRWKGCRCASKGDTLCCHTMSPCLCRQYNRECDPELCGRCGAKDGAPCRNVNIRLGRKKRTKVIFKQYPWGPGWGLQLEDQVQEGEFIDEYIGEAVVGLETALRTSEAHHLHRNYLFGIDVRRTVDSARAANETRFINHAADLEEINLKAEALFIDGEPRIVFLATRNIKVGEELFFHYGEGYFVDSDNSDVNSETT